MKSRYSAPRCLLLALLTLPSCMGELTPGQVSSSPGPRQPAEPEQTQPCVRSGPGSVTAHRLNATEYDNTVRDLLGEASGPAAVFPSDDAAFGFDNNADALAIDPLLFENYEAAAESSSAAAVARESAIPLAQRTWLTCAPTAATEVSVPPLGLAYGCFP